MKQKIKGPRKTFLKRGKIQDTRYNLEGLSFLFVINLFGLFSSEKANNVSISKLHVHKTIYLFFIFLLNTVFS